MRAGLLRELVTVQQRISTQDPYGQAVDAWSEVAKTWASVQPLRGNERFTAAQTKAAIDTKVTMRFRNDVMPGRNRILFGARVLDVESVINIDERDRTIEILCKEAQS
jgi:SPP1 family predicted phage head-tail adaptor